MSTYGAYNSEQRSERPWPDTPHAVPPPEPPVNATRLWGGGAATAVVAAGLVVVAFLIVRRLFDIPVLGTDLEGGVVVPSMLTYAVWAAMAAVALTGAMHLLLLTRLPRPAIFFGWIGAISVAIAVVAPLSLAAPVDERLATAAVNLVVGAVSVGLVSVAANASIRERGMYRLTGQR